MVKRGSIIYRILLVAYLAAVAYLCFADFHDIPETEKTILGIRMDKIVHFLMFLPFPFMVNFSLPAFIKKRRIIASSVVALACGAAVAALTEIVQSRLPYRSGDPADFLTDVIAMTVGTVAVLAINLSKAGMK